MPADSPPPPRVTIVLPHREGFGPARAGAVAMVVRRLAAARPRYRALVIGPPLEGLAYPGIDFLPARMQGWWPRTATQRYAVALARLLARLPPGLVEVHNKPDLALWLARRFPQRPVGLFLHNDPRSMRGARSPQARRRLLARLSHVVTVSEFLRRCLLEGVETSPDPMPAVIHNALDMAGLPASLPPHQRERLILFAGRVVPDKGPDLFVAACARALPQLPGWRAEMIGADGFSPDAADTGFIRGLRPQADAAGVVLRGFQPHDAVLHAMSRAAIVVVPSRWEEPFGLTALEAMACGAALVCSGRGGLAEVAGDAAVTIDPDDPAAFAQALLDLAGDTGRRAVLSARGERRAREQFSAAAAAAALDDLRDRTLAAFTRSGRMEPWSKMPLA